MPGLTYTLKADATGIEKGFQTAQQRVDDFRKKNSKKPLLQFEGERKAERNIVGLATELANARTGSEMLAISLGRVGDIFQNSLAVGTAFAIGSAMFSMATEADKAFYSFRELAQEANTGINKAAVIGTIGDIAKGLKDYQQQLKNIRAEEQRQDTFAGWWGTRLNAMMGGPSVEEVESEPKKRQAEAQQARNNLMIRSIELSEQQMQIADMLASGDDEGLKKLRERLELENELANIRMMGLDKDAKDKAIAAAYAMSEARAKAEEIELAKQQEEEAKKIAEESKKRDEEEQKRKDDLERERAANVAREGEKQAREIEADEQRVKAAEKAQREKVEKQLTLDDRMALAREKVREAQERVRIGGKGIEKARADLAEAQSGLQDVQEEQIQRIMGGSTSAAAAQRADRREQRARARAQRILQKRQDIRDMDAKARGEWAKPAEMNLQGPQKKDPEPEKQTKLLDNIEKELTKLNQRLTVA